MKRCPGSSQDRVRFAVVGTGHGQDPKVIQINLTPLAGERDSLPGRRALFPAGPPVAEVSNCLLLGWAGFHLNSLSLVSSVSTADVNTCFLISSLFP